jgi:hypothetical protein
VGLLLAGESSALPAKASFAHELAKEVFMCLGTYTKLSRNVPSPVKEASFYNMFVPRGEDCL